MRWLEGGRCAPLDDIGYAFLFFYGLERRLLVDDEDFSPIVKEVVRLLEAYTSSGSFDGYLSRFLSYSLARAGIGTLKDKWFEAVFERTRAQRDEQHLAVGLAWLYMRAVPLPSDWALRIARLDPRAPRSVVVDRLADRFRELFGRRYHERFGGGMSLDCAGSDLHVTYRPANPTLRHLSLYSGHFNPVTVPNIMGLRSQFDPLVEIWSACIDELKPLSRVVARGADVSSREAYEALPEDLKPSVEHPDKPHWDRLASEWRREDGFVLVDVGRLASIQGLEERAKLTARQSESLARTAHQVGFVIEPDARVTNRPYEWEETVALVRPEESPELPKDSRYAGASLMLELGMFVASADGTVGDDEVDHIAHFLASQFLLDPPDARRLEALKRVLLGRVPSIAGIGRRLQSALGGQEREAVGRFLVGVAAANGTIDREEVAALRKAYKALGVDGDVLSQLLREFQAAMSEPVEVHRPSGPPTPGERIPERGRDGGELPLDEGLLRRILGETREVARLIGEAMSEAEAEEIGPMIVSDPSNPTIAPAPADQRIRPTIEGPSAPAPPAVDPRFDGLSPKYCGVLAALLDRPAWSPAEFEELIRSHNLMVSGTIDVINEWSQDRLDDLLIEGQAEGFVVHAHLIAE